MLIGGAATYTFLKAKGIKTGNSLIDFEHLSWITKALSKFDDKIMLPSDHIILPLRRDALPTMVKGDIPDNMAGFDIGNETIQDTLRKSVGKVLEQYFGMGQWDYLK